MMNMIMRAVITEPDSNSWSLSKRASYNNELELSLCFSRATRISHLSQYFSFKSVFI